MRAYNMPGRLTSKVYFARPDTLSGPSKRLTCVPMTAGFAGQLNFGSAGGGWFAAPRPPCAGRFVLATADPLCALDRFENSREGAAATDVAVETLSNLFVSRIRILFEE